MCATSPLHWCGGIGVLTRFAQRVEPTLSASDRTSLFAEAGGGLYWVAAGIVLATTGGVANAWVLLVEILRLRCRQDAASVNGPGVPERLNGAVSKPLWAFRRARP